MLPSQTSDVRGSFVRYTKSEPGAEATGSFPRCSTTPVITESGPLGKNETIVDAFRPGRYRCCVKSQSSEERHQHDRNSIQYRERSDRMPALNQRFKSSCDYRVPASGRFARGTVLGGDSNRIIPTQSPSFYPVATAPGSDFVSPRSTLS